MNWRQAFNIRIAGPAARAGRAAYAKRIGGLVLCGILASVAWGAADPAAPNPGLQGLLPAEIPAELNDLLAQLPPTWQKFTEELAGDLNQLYTGSLDVAGQQQTLARLESKVGVIRTALADARYRAIHDPLRALEGALQRRIEVIGAALQVLSADAGAAQAARLQAAKAGVAQAVAEAEANLDAVKNGAAWVGYLQLPQLAGAVQPASAPQAAAAAARDVQARLANVQDPASQQFLDRPAIANLRQSTGLLLAAAEQAAAPPAADAVRDQLKTLLNSLEQYEASGDDVAAAAARGSFDALRGMLGEAVAPLGEALQRHYFNYNFRLTATEAFLNRVLSERREEQGAVRDCILGADVYGWQYTSTSASFDLLPSPQNAKFAVTLNGQVNSNTEGVTRQATVFTQGNHSFYATKEIDFDGDRFATHPAQVSVNANNTTTGAQTKVSRLPLFGRVADNVAVRAAERKRPESEAIAASRVSDRVGPELDKEVNKQFGQANVSFEKVENSLKKNNLFPDARFIRTTGDELLVRTRVMTPGSLGGSMPVVVQPPANGLLLQLHDSLVNHSLDELNLRNRTMTEGDLRKLIEERLSEILDRPVTFEQQPAAAPQPAATEAESSSEPKALIFADKDPLRVRFAGDQVVIVLRAGFKREGQNDIPEQIVTIPLNFKTAGQSIIATHGDISIDPAQPPASVPEQIALAGIVRRKLESSLPERKFDRVLNVKRDDGRSPIRLNLIELKAIDGWLNLIFE